MDLFFLSNSFCATITLATFAATYAMNTIKNNIANNIKSKLEKGNDLLTINNYDLLKNKISVVTNAEFFVRLLWITSIIQLILSVFVYGYSKVDFVQYGILRCSELTFFTLFILGILVAFISICCVFTSPEQNLLSKKWELDLIKRNDS